MLYSFLETYNLLQTSNEQNAMYASSASAFDIDAADARTFLRESGIWYRSDPLNMGGSVQAAIESGQLPEQLTQALGEFWSSLFGGSSTRLLTNSNVDIAFRIYSAVNALVEAGAMTELQSVAFYNLGGGLMFPATTAADVQQAKDDHAAQEAAAAAEEARLQAEMELRDEWETAMMDAGAEEAFYNGDKAALIVAINAAVAAISALERG